MVPDVKKYDIEYDGIERPTSTVVQWPNLAKPVCLTDFTCAS